jgi:hypothetical protein
MLKDQKNERLKFFTYSENKDFLRKPWVFPFFVSFSVLYTIFFYSDFIEFSNVLFPVFAIFVWKNAFSKKEIFSFCPFHKNNISCKVMCCSNQSGEISPVKSSSNWKDRREKFPLQMILHCCCLNAEENFCGRFNKLLSTVFHFILSKG